jgi:hypothetical protein
MLSVDNQHTSSLTIRTPTKYCTGPSSLMENLLLSNCFNLWISGTPHLCPRPAHPSQDQCVAAWRLDLGVNFEGFGARERWIV